MAAAERGIQFRVIGPRGGAGEPLDGAAFALPAGPARQLIGAFEGHLAQAPAGGRLQMLVDVPDVPVSVINLDRFGGSGTAAAPAAAVAHVLRGTTGDRPALAGVYLLLSGADPAADEAAVAAVELSRDAGGRPLPLNPKIYATLRADARPLIALLFFNDEAVRDASLRMLATCLAEAFFGSIRRARANQRQSR